MGNFSPLWNIWDCELGHFYEIFLRSVINFSFQMKQFFFSRKTSVNVKKKNVL